MIDPNEGLVMLMHSQMKREFELVHAPSLPAIHKLMLALDGIATCSTQELCAQTHAQIARESLLRFELSTGITLEDARSAEASRRAIEELKEAP